MDKIPYSPFGEEGANNPIEDNREKRLTLPLTLEQLGTEVDAISSALIEQQNLIAALRKNPSLTDEVKLRLEITEQHLKKAAESFKANLVEPLEKGSLDQ